MSKRRRRKPLPEPVAGVRIDTLAHDGRGVARVAGKTVFVDGALPGELVDIEYRTARRAYDEAAAARVLEPSPDRVQPKCRHFGICGGCSLQHMAPAAQIRAKQEVLLDNLQRIGGTAPVRLLEPLTGAVWGYRRKARLGVRDVQKKGRVLVGFREKRSAYIADLARCEVLYPSVGSMLEELSAFIETLDARGSIPQIEVAVSDAVTALVFRHLDTLSEEDERSIEQFAIEHDFHVYLQPGGEDTARPFMPLDSRLSYRLPDQDIEICFRPVDFTQVNADMNRQMVARVLELLAPGADDHVLDLFCGLGNFTLPIARLAGRVTGVEGEEGLVSRACDNARLNRLDNVDFHVADLEGNLAGQPWAGGRFSKVLLDPPRCGAANAIDTLTALRPQRIVYVSCHPGSLARDAGKLVNEYGYTPVAAGVMDMFPHTAHVESIMLFEL